jgi:uncharacterized membrane protein
MLSRYYEKAPSSPESFQGFTEGFQVGIIVALFGFLLYFFIRNIIAMRNPDRMKKLYISETDERKLLIMQKSGSDGMNIVMYGLAVGSAVAGNFDDTVFFALLGACVFVALVRGLLKLYYQKKY